MESFMLAAMLMLAALPAVSSLAIPRACAGKNMTFPRACCPDYRGSPCGGLYNRGRCLTRTQSRAVPDPTVTNDFRSGNFLSMFNAWCVCYGNFGGINCGECKFGFQGEDCRTLHRVYRRDITSYSQAERIRLWSELHYCKSCENPDWVILQAGERNQWEAFNYIPCSYYDAAAACHYYATLPFLSGNREINFASYAHNGPGFLLWHRWFLFAFERLMQNCLRNPNWALPYHRWESNSTWFLNTNEYLGANYMNGRLHPGSVFSQWRCVCAGYSFSKTICMMEECECERPKILRKPHMNFDVPNLPTQSNIDTCYTYQTFYSTTAGSVSTCLEGWHNNVHAFLMGTMGQVALSACDPYFFMHHCNTDRLFEIAIQRYAYTPASYPPTEVFGQGYDDCVGAMYSCYPLRNVMAPSETLGAMYM